jgi:hypothetical protein
MIRILKKIVGVLLISVLLTATSQAQKSYKSLSEVGLPEEIPNYVLSALSHDSSYIEHVIVEETIGSAKNELEAFLIYSKDKNGNIDLRAKYDQYTQTDESSLLDSLKKETKTQYRIRNYGTIYDPKSIKVTVIDEHIKHVFVKFSPYALPQDISYFRHMVADFLIIDGVLTSAVIKNSKPFIFNRNNINEYEMTMEFLSENDEYFIKNKTSVSKGTSGGKSYLQKITGNFVAYYNGPDSKVDLVLDPVMLSKASNPIFKEVKMELSRALPFMADMVRQRGIDLPLPFGIAVNYRNQENDFDFTSFSVAGIPSEDLEKLFDPQKSAARVKINSLSLKVDAYILPFWNVFAVLGKNKTNVDMQAHFNGINACIGLTLPNGSCAGQPVELPSTSIPISLELDYQTAGLGTTLSVGYQNFFASLTGTYVKTVLKDSDEPGTTRWIFSTMIGYQFIEWRAQVLVGAEFQDYSSKMEGLVGDLAYDIGINSDKWSYSVGARKEFGQHFNLIALASKGSGRHSFTVSAEYRF